jgi:minor extracellular serine protease Vpr
VALGQRMIVVLRAPSLADRVRAAGGRASDSQERRWTELARSEQQRVLLGLVTRGIFITPERRYTRVLNGFSAVLDPSVISLLERMPEVTGVYRVRAAFPAAAAGSGAELAAAARGAGLNRLGTAPLSLDGAGVRIALLDTGVDSQAPYLHGHVLLGMDVAGGGIDARPHAGPGGVLERHGTEMAGILVGAGRDGLSGVAPGATVLPIRVGGWQRDAAGRWLQHARSDAILAGLERAVDPDSNGNAHDAARIAVIPLAEPFGAFEDDPLSRAAAGAADLDTLVVVPAGNDGPAGPVFGSLSGPAGAPAALTVGAADLRPRTVEARLLVRDGLRVLLDRPVPLLGSIVPARSTTSRLTSPSGSSGSRGLLFDRRGMSKVAGGAVLLPAGASPGATASRAARAGASLVLLAGDSLPAGGLALGEALDVPVLSVPASLLAAARSSRSGRLQLSVGESRSTGNEQAGRVAAFSSWGLAHGGHPKPEVVGPGVGVVTVDPGATRTGSSRFVAVNGASAAAVAAAGQAAILAEARPTLDARGLKSAIVGTARALPGDPETAQGEGLVDIGSAASAEAVAAPASLAFGRAARGKWSGLRTFVLRNVSTRSLRIYLADDADGHPGLAITIEPARVLLAPGKSVEIGVRARLARPERRGVVTGAVTVAPLEGPGLRIPWAVVFEPPPSSLIGSVQLSAKSFKPSDVSPAVLTAQLGSIRLSDGRLALEPLSHLDVQLETRKHKRIGLLTRLRDVLPGRYSFGITGRGPGGRVLPPGRYGLRLVAFPSAGGKAVTQSIAFKLQ